jgi:hypothetical protein
MGRACRVKVFVCFFFVLTFFVFVDGLKTTFLPKIKLEKVNEI